MAGEFGTLTSSTCLDEEHLGLVLQQRAVGVIKGLKHPVQLRERERERGNRERQDRGRERGNRERQDRGRERGETERDRIEGEGEGKQRETG